MLSLMDKINCFNLLDKIPPFIQSKLIWGLKTDKGNVQNHVSPTLRVKERLQLAF